MPLVTKEEFYRLHGPIGTTLSFGAPMDLRSVWIYGHDMTKPFEERFHVITEADYDTPPKKTNQSKKSKKKAK